MGLARPVKTHQGQGQVPGQQIQALRTPATPPQMTPHGPMVLQTSNVPETDGSWHPTLTPMGCLELEPIKKNQLGKEPMVP